MPYHFVRVHAFGSSRYHCPRVEAQVEQQDQEAPQPDERQVEPDGQHQGWSMRDRFVRDFRESERDWQTWNRQDRNVHWPRTGYPVAKGDNKGKEKGKGKDKGSEKAKGKETKDAPQQGKGKSWLRDSDSNTAGASSSREGKGRQLENTAISKKSTSYKDYSQICIADG